MRRTHLPLLCLIPTLAVPALAPAAQVSPLQSRAQVAEVAMNDLLANPSGFQSQRVRTRGVFVERGELFNPHVSHFQPGRYQNLILWADRLPLWEAEVRGRPLLTAYVHTQSAANGVLGKLAKYQTVDIVARVVTVSEGEPWVEIESIAVVPDIGAFSDQSVYQVQQAIALGKDGAFDLADDHFRAALGNALPAFARAQVTQFRAEHLVLAGRHADALPVIAEALAMIDADPGASPAQRAAIRITRAKSLIETARGETRRASLAEAASRAAQATTLDPARGEAYAVLGIALAGLDRFDEARRECDKAVRLRPNDAEVRWYLGRILDRQGRHDEAIASLAQAISLTPKDHRVHKSIATAYANRGAKGGGEQGAAADFGAALTEYDLTLRLNPKDAESQILAGQAILAALAAKSDIARGDAVIKPTRELAAERFARAVTIDPKSVPAYEAQAALAKEMENAGVLEAALAKLAELEPTVSTRAVALADARWAANRKPDAIAGLRAWAKANPRHFGIRLTLANRLVQAGDDAGALAAAEEVLALNSGNEAATRLIADIRARQAGKAEADRKAAADKAAADRAKAEADRKAAADKAAADRAKAEADRKAAEKAAADKAAADKAAREKAAQPPKK